MPTAEIFRHRVAEHNLYGVVHLPDRDGLRPIVVLCHGFKGFMDWGFFPHLAELLASRGFVVIRFNLSGSGMKPGDELVSDLTAFRTASFSKDLVELRSVVSAAGREIANGVGDPARIALFGHSRGGGTAVLAGADLPISALVTWSAVATFDRMSGREKQTWRSDGELTILNARTGQELPIGVEVLTDLEARATDLDIQGAARRSTAPWLILHGSEDETVPIEEAHTLAAAANSEHSLVEVDGASHTYGVGHPFTGPTPQLIEAMNATQSWLKTHLA